MTHDEPHHNLTDDEVTERIRQEADRLLIRWLFGPPGRHIRDYVVAPSTSAVAVATTMANTLTKSEESKHGKTSLVPAA